MFAAGGMFATQMVWKYNLLYVLDSDVDSKGLFYPRALIHLTIGLYLAEICLIGLLALKAAYAPLGLMVLFFIFTGLVHVSLGDAIRPLLLNLPQTLSLEEEIQEEEKAKALRETELARARLDRDGGAAGGGGANDYYDTEQVFGDEEQLVQPDDEQDGEEEEEGEDGDGDGDGEEHEVTGTRAVEGAASIGATMSEWLKDKSRRKVDAEMDKAGIGEILDKLKRKLGFRKPDRQSGGQAPGFLARWLHPEEYEDFVRLRKAIPGDQLPAVEYPAGFGKRCYLAPETWAAKPALWIPRDEARVSRQEVAHTSKYAPISDKGAELDEKGRVVAYYDRAPMRKPRYLL